MPPSDVYGTLREHFSHRYAAQKTPHFEAKESWRKCVLHRGPGAGAQETPKEDLQNQNRRRDLYAEQKLIERTNQGTASLALPHELRLEAVEARKRLEPLGATLTQAVEFFLQHHVPENSQKATDKVVQEFLETKRQAGCRASYLETLGYKLSRFGAAFRDQPISTLSHQAIQEWVQNLKVSPRSQGHYLADLQNLFNFARKHGYVRINPAGKLDKVRHDHNPVGILTVRQTKHLLATTEATDPEMVAFVVLGLFAGIRHEERQRLDWNAIDLKRKFVEIRSAAAKTRHRRIVDLKDNAIAWLAKVAKTEGPIAPSDSAYRLSTLIKKAKIDPYPRNALRHSFASYLMAETENAPKVAAQLGQTNIDTLYRNYREVVSREDAAGYFELFPDRW